MIKNKVTIIIHVFNEKNYIDKVIKRINKNILLNLDYNLLLNKKIDY